MMVGRFGFGFIRLAGWLVGGLFFFFFGSVVVGACEYGRRNDIKTVLEWMRKRSV